MWRAGGIDWIYDLRRISPEWRNDFQVFYDHVSQLPNYGDKEYTLDRIDNDGNYKPGNVRWATWREQNRNTRRNVMLTYNGKTKCLTDWAEELEMSRNTLTDRLKTGWSVERALTQPVQYQHWHHKR